MVELLKGGAAIQFEKRDDVKPHQNKNHPISKEAPELPNLHRIPRKKPRVNGKFLFIGNNKFYVKGVTYGTFEPDGTGLQFPSIATVEQDFQRMAASGINAVRTYTVPPRWLLDLADKYYLYVMVGIPWEQHIAFLEDKKTIRSIKSTIRRATRTCANHPAILSYAIGNEIPSTIVRWYGRRRIERFLKNLFLIIKSEDPDSLVTYVNFPTTEYLQLEFLDFISFNVYLESQDQLEAYLARLHNLAGEKPVLMAEIGLDSKRNNEQQQCLTLEWQINSVFRTGCAGTFIFAWTDEWYRGGFAIEDWDFGLTTRDREPKAALQAVTVAFADSPFSSKTIWPGFSVVVCSCNGASTIQQTLEALDKLDYPDFDVIVVDDGSRDDTAKIAEQYDVSLICTKNCGLSSARNTGYRSSSKELIAFIDDDAYPDTDWLHYLAITYLNSDVAGVGGPNIAPVDANMIADCVANAPGGPVQVLLSDTVAEHVPGCNMSFRKSALDAVGGFDPRFRAAGDDVDICWRVQDQIGPIAFHPAAMNWHHRRNTLRAYWKQQNGYGKAEALLEDKWPEKYNTVGHINWQGRLYGKGLTRNLGSLNGRIYHGVWGSAPFQGLYRQSGNTLLSMPLMPEWHLLIGVLALLTALGFGWSPLLVVTPVLAIAVLVTLAQALLSAVRSSYNTRPLTLGTHLKLIAITTMMHLTQPLARLCGRVICGLTPWRRRGMRCWNKPERKKYSFWQEESKLPSDRLQILSSMLSKSGLFPRPGGEYDAWDLEVRGGLFGGARVLMAIEEHGSSCELVRYLVYPNWPVLIVAPLFLLGALVVGSGLADSWTVCVLSSLLLVGLSFYALLDSGRAMGTIDRVLHDKENSPHIAQSIVT